MRDQNKHWQGQVVRRTRDRFPERWIKVDRETGVVLGGYSGTLQPAAPHSGVVVVPSERPR